MSYLSAYSVQFLKNKLKSPLNTNTVSVHMYPFHAISCFSLHMQKFAYYLSNYMSMQSMGTAVLKYKSISVNENPQTIKTPKDGE